MTNAPEKICFVNCGLPADQCACYRHYLDATFLPTILATEHDRIVAEKDAEIAAARDKALEDAATLANNRIRRWLEIEPPYNGDLDEAIALIEELPAAIRAMKGGSQ